MNLPQIQGSASDIMELYARGYYTRMFDGAKIVLLCEDNQTLYTPPADVEYYLEILWGYEHLGQD